MEDSSSAAEDTKSCPRGHWRPAEDEKLRQLVEQYGAQNWNSIAEKLQGRSGLYLDIELIFKFCNILSTFKLKIIYYLDDLIQGLII